MFSTKKRTGRYIPTAFGTPEYLPIKGEELDQYVRRLLAGDINAMKPIIIGHIRLAIKIAGQYCYRKSFEHELLSTAFEALVEGCYNVYEGSKELPDRNITGYLISTIHSRCNRRVWENQIVRIPMSSQIKAKKEKRTIFAPKVICQKCNKAYIQYNHFDFYDFLLSCCINNRERLIIKLKQQSYTNTEIAQEFDLSVTWVSRIIKGIELRYNEKMKELES